MPNTIYLEKSIPPTYLYIKRHSITGLKYFGKTKQDPYEYIGSGRHWRNHINKHGKMFIETLWISEPYTDAELIKEAALKFSIENDIVNSLEWANLKLEDGLDGGIYSEETKQKISKTLTGRKIGSPSEEHRQKISESLTGRKRPEFSKEWKDNLSKSGKGKTSHNKGKPVWNDGFKNVWSYECPSPEFKRGILRPAHPGRTIGSTGMTWFTDENKNVLSHICPDGYRKGRVTGIESKMKGKKSGYKWCNNGIENKLLKELPGPEWSLGRLKWVN